VGNPCRVCSSADLNRRFGELVAQGWSDQKIADALGISRSGAQRHRTAHVVAVARAVIQAGAKDAPAREQRQQIIAAAESGTLAPEDYLSLAAIIGELKGIGGRLERVATAAEDGGQLPIAVSAATAQIRLNENKARLAGHGGFAPARNRDGGESQPTLQIIFNLGGQTQELKLVDAGEVIENEPAPFLPDLSGLNQRG